MTVPDASLLGIDAFAGQSTATGPRRDPWPALRDEAVGPADESLPSARPTDEDRRRRPARRSGVCQFFEPFLHEN